VQARWSAQKDSKAQQKEFEETVGLIQSIMKDQDLSYVRNQKSKDITKVERLRATPSRFDGEPPRNESIPSCRNKKDDFDVALAPFRSTAAEPLTDRAWKLERDSPESRYMATRAWRRR
jgi:hypothetical protein